MEHICTSDELATLSSDYPWLVAHDLDPEEDDTGDQIFYTLHDPMSHYRCQIPELVGRRIRGCFHGWMIISKRNPQYMEWSLWNPVVSKLIWLPRMILGDEDDENDFPYCCLSSPPDHPDSVLLLIKISYRKPQRIVFIFCNRKRRKRLRRWTEMSYSQQMKNIGEFPNRGGGVLLHPTCCNGNIYALTYAQRPPLLIQVRITVVKEKQAVINLVPLVNLPWPHWPQIYEDYLFLKGSCTRLFCIRVCLDTMDKKPCHVYLNELDMGSMVWTEIKEGLRDTVFFVYKSYVNNDLVSSSPPIASELGGGYIHILKHTGDEIYSYNIKDKTISMSSTRCLGLPIRKSIFIWTIPGFRLPVKAKCKLQRDHDQTVQLVRSATPPTITNDDDDVVEQMNELPLLSVPFDVLENVMKFCVGIEYLNFRATCKLCRLAAPMHKYSLTSPWLVVLDKDRGNITFKHPTFGDNNYIKASPELFYHHRILCSRHGWLLLYIADHRITFFNPFTADIRKLPELPKQLSGARISFSFSAPPTSPDCMVVAYSSDCRLHIRVNVTFHHVGGKPSWYTIPLDYRHGHIDFYFPICCGEDVYTLFVDGGLQVLRDIQARGSFSQKTVVGHVFRRIQARGNFSREMVVKRGPERSRFAMYYHVKCDQHHLLVIVEEFGESVEVFKLNASTQEWEEIDGLGKHMIYICDSSCVCMDAEIPEMENKIYFPRLHSENGKIVFYSLETSRFHTFNGRNVEQNLTDLFETKQTTCLHAWIEPTWS